MKNQWGADAAYGVILLWIEAEKLKGLDPEAYLQEVLNRSPIITSTGLTGS
uniref:hypothetical protein n=1 Tax=Agrobacterium vitis TaxID=373 RepID=UPI00155D9156|nr:hypothetical protein [Agrobacterium vitis]